MCSCDDCRSSGLRRAASAGRRAGAQPASQPQPATAAIGSGMQLSSNSIPALISSAPGQRSAANADAQAAIVSGHESALSDSSMPLQPVASVNPLVLSNVPAVSKEWGAVSREAESGLHAEPSDKALGLAGAGSQGICPLLSLRKPCLQCMLLVCPVMSWASSGAEGLCCSACSVMPGSAYTGLVLDIHLRQLSLPLQNCASRHAAQTCTSTHLPPGMGEHIA